MSFANPMRHEQEVAEYVLNSSKASCARAASRAVKLCGDPMSAAANPKSTVVPAAKRAGPAGIQSMVQSKVTSVSLKHQYWK